MKSANVIETTLIVVQVTMAVVVGIGILLKGNKSLNIEAKVHLHNCTLQEEHSVLTDS